MRLAPFQVLAAGSETFEERDHLWHLALADALVAADDRGVLQSTRRLVVGLGSSWADGVSWWTELTAAGGEGMVVKPVANLVRGKRGPMQPGIKVRGREYLRIIYGPDYTEPANLARLRERSTTEPPAEGTGVGLGVERDTRVSPVLPAPCGCGRSRPGPGCPGAGRTG